MKRIFFSAVLTLIFFLSPQLVSAQANPYIVEQFHSDITINKDSSLTIVETLQVNFNERRHGIYRYIPTTYRTGEKTIYSRLRVQSVVDELGKRYSYKVNQNGDSVVLRIGDEDIYVTGYKTYKVTYRVRNIIQTFPDHHELYWNVSGDGWDTDIVKATATVKSDFAQITQVQCITGNVGSLESSCTENHTETAANFTAAHTIGNGQDMTVVVGLNINNQLTFQRSVGDLISDYWGYPVAVLPLLIMFLVWFKKGRDIRYIGDNIYYDQTNKIETVPVINKREFLPMVYSPIEGLTPAEVGTLLDERVDIHDIVAEIMELGRLGYLTIEKIAIKLAKDDYLFKRTKKVPGKMKEYQKYLLEELFSIGEVNNQVKLTELKTKFYPKLAKFREKLYTHMTEQGYFPHNPETVRGISFVLMILLAGGAFVLSLIFLDQTGDILPVMIFALTVAPLGILAFFMPRKTAKGYALSRQVKGLAFYLKKGKWREEFNEKNLFLRDMLPLAISLGVVRQLAKDMESLGVPPPSYFNTHSIAWSSSLYSFNSSAGSVMAAGSSSSGKWSGGSGFSGGSSGGGFGGGGGGSW